MSASCLVASSGRAGCACAAPPWGIRASTSCAPPITCGGWRRLWPAIANDVAQTSLLASPEPAIPSPAIRDSVSPSNAGSVGRSIMDGPSSRRASANDCSARELRTVQWAWADAAGVGMQVDVRLKIRLLLVILGLRQCYAVWRRPRSGRWESRETAALRLGTAHAVGDRPRRTGISVIRICRDGDSRQERRSQNRGFAKSKHMTPSSVPRPR